MEILKQPLTQAQIREQIDEDGYIEGVVAMKLSKFIDNDLEGVLDELSERLVGSIRLMEIDYNVVGHEGNILHVLVSGNASEVLDEEDEEDE